MKTILKYLAVLFIISCTFLACKKMDKAYQSFIVPGGITYAGKANTPIAHAGINRINLTWMRGSDPNVTRAKVYWNNYLDSMDVNYPASGSLISVMINNLVEKSYSFMIKTYDTKGNSSVPVEVIGNSYGSNYQSSILTRPVTLSILSPANDSLTINWQQADFSNGAYGMEIKYTNLAGNTLTKKLAAKDMQTIILDYKPGTVYDYRTVYLPDSLGIDTFYTTYSTENVSKKLSKTGWKVLAFSSQHTTAANAATNFIDGKTDSRWHTYASNPVPPYPHYITIDMLTPKTISAFEVFRMKDDDRACDEFQLQVSNDNINWINLGSNSFNRRINDGQVYNVTSRPIARYFKFTGISGPQIFMVMGEINVYGN